MDKITSSDTIKQTKVIASDGTTSPACFVLWGFETDEYDIRVSLRYADLEISQAADNYFSALNAIRKDLEEKNCLVLCYGASENVHVSGMSLSMSEGILAYKLILGKRTSQDDTVNIFDTGDDVTPSTIAQQQLFYDRWRNSLTSSENKGR